MESYVSLNTKYRAETKNDFEKNQCKFLNCSVFGKPVQINKKQRHIRLLPMKEQETDSLLQ